MRSMKDSIEQTGEQTESKSRSGDKLDEDLDLESFGDKKKKKKKRGILTEVESETKP